MAWSNVVAMRRVLLVIVLLGVGAPGVPVRANDLGLVQTALRAAGDPWAVPGAPVPEPIVGIGPGSALRIWFPGGGGVGCTANFVWEDAAGDLYLGAAGHCFLPGGTSATHGPGADYDASHVRPEALVQECVAGCEPEWVPLGRVAYARQTGLGADFGIARIPGHLRDRVRTRMPTWNGPVAEARPRVSDVLVHYGQGAFVGSVIATRGRAGFCTNANPDFWIMGGQAIFGDSGSPMNVAVSAREGRTLQGPAAGGIVTHSALGLGGLAAGTTVPRAERMALEAGLTVRVKLQGEPVR